MTAFVRGVGPALRRLWQDVRHPFSPNPEDAKGRQGWIDVTHAWSNVWVETVRSVARDEDAPWIHWTGRGIAWGIPFGILVYTGVTVL